MLQVITTYPLLTLIVALGILALLGVDIGALVLSVRKLIGFKEAGLITAKAVEDAGETAKRALASALEEDPSGESVKVKLARAAVDAILNVKTKTRLNTAFAPTPTKDAMRHNVDTVDGKKPTPKRKILGAIARIGLGIFGIRLP